MVTEKNYQTIIEAKIKEAKSRAAPKRDWVKLSITLLDSSIQYRMETSERFVFIEIILMSVKFGPVAGLISDNDCRAMPHDFLAHEAHCSIEEFESALEKAKADDSIFENGHGIFLTHFDDYQFTEYDRQKPYREAKKLAQGRPAEKDYKGGRYGHMVKD